jgi:hypothetical protein
MIMEHPCEKQNNFVLTSNQSNDIYSSMIFTYYIKSNGEI